MHRLVCAVLAVMFICSAGVCGVGGGYPKIANLWGWPSTDADTSVYANYDLIITTGSSPDDWKKLRQAMRARNPESLILGSAPFMNVEPPSEKSWLKDEWYLRKPNGEKVNWWVGQLYAPNLFLDGYIQGTVEHCDVGYGEKMRTGDADGFMFDSVVGNVSWYGEVDTNLDGTADKTADIDDEWQRLQNVFFDKLREKFPSAIIMANDVDPRHAPHLHGRLFEGSRLLDLAPAGYKSPQEIIYVLNEWSSGSLQPPVTFAFASHPIGWQWWRLQKSGVAKDMSTPGEIDWVRRSYPRMRTGLMMSLMSDTYYCFDFGTTWYGYPLLYAEYDVPLGKPLGAYREVFREKPEVVFEWKAGDSTDAFEIISGKATSQGIVLSLDDPKAEIQSTFATRPDKLRLETGKTYRVVADCVLEDRPSDYLQCVVRSQKAGEKHDKGARYTGDKLADGVPGQNWHIEVNVTPDEFDDYAIRLNQKGAGTLRLTGMKVSKPTDSYMVREFEGGIALFNPMLHPITVKLDRTMSRIKDDAAPRHIIEIDDVTIEPTENPDKELFLQKYRDYLKLRVPSDFSADEGWEIRKEDGHHCLETYRATMKNGLKANWTFTAPSTDTYTVYTWVKGGSEMTDGARYSLKGGGRYVGARIDQRKGNAEWIKLFEAELVKGRSYSIEVVSGGVGTTAADAVRLESRARFNDGSRVRKVELDALDGVILLNSSGRKGNY